MTDSSKVTIYVNVPSKTGFVVIQPFDAEPLGNDKYRLINKNGTKLKFIGMEGTKCVYEPYFSDDVDLRFKSFETGDIVIGRMETDCDVSGEPLLHGMFIYTCPCCGYKTFERDLPEITSFEICPICFWQDDDYFEGGGANSVSLRTAQKNFLSFGAIEERLLKAVRKPNENDERDPNWRPLE